MAVICSSDQRINLFPDMLEISHNFEASKNLRSIADIGNGVSSRLVGVNTRIKTSPIRVITITDHKVGSFSDISLGHKIFSHDQVCVL